MTRFKVAVIAAVSFMTASAICSDALAQRCRLFRGRCQQTSCPTICRTDLSIKLTCVACNGGIECIDSNCRDPMGYLNCICGGELTAEQCKKDFCDRKPSDSYSCCDCCRKCCTFSDINIGKGKYRRLTCPEVTLLIPYSQCQRPDAFLWCWYLSGKCSGNWMSAPESCSWLGGCNGTN